MLRALGNAEADEEKPLAELLAPEGPRPVSVEVQERMTYLYNYGIKMLVGGLISESDLKTIVLDRMAKRVEMTGAEFDRSLGMEAVPRDRRDR